MDHLSVVRGVFPEVQRVMREDAFVLSSTAVALR
jgi:hypothetical protein